MWVSSIIDAPRDNTRSGAIQYRCAGTATRARSRSDLVVSSYPEWKQDFNVRPIINSIVLALIVTGRHNQSRSEEHTSELQSPYDLVCRLLLEKKKKKQIDISMDVKKINTHNHVSHECVVQLNRKR